jgi:two-component system chemotaxis sensor kinase CheA
MTPRDELIEQFLIEGRDLVERALGELAALRADGADRAALDGVFRTIHTLKGSVGLFDLPALGAVLHAAETALEQARAEGRVSPHLVDGACRVVDLTEAWLEALERDAPADDLVAQARALARRLGSGEGSAADDGRLETPWIPASSQGGSDGVAIRYRPAPDAFFRGDDPLAIIRDVPALVSLSITTDGEEAPSYDPFRCRLAIDAVSAASLAEVRQALRLVADQVEVQMVRALAAAPPTADPGAARAPTDGALRSLRVDATRLDELAALVDELVIAKNALAHATAGLTADSGRARTLADAQAGLDRLVKDLHGSVTRLRLIGLGHVFSRFPRQVREIADALGKDVELVMSGDQVAVDKSVAERLFEPLLHLVRNALDHGVETPEARRAAGKRLRAVLSLAARALGEEIVIEVGDDGRGIDAARVRSTAVAQGLVSADRAAELADEAAVDLVFAAGFSTAGRVSDVSGRGVGMDAVRAAVSELGGRIALDNRPGQGLTVRLTLPARVVLTRILVVKAGGERFGVPLDTISETHRVQPEQVSAIRAGRAYVRRDTVIPLLRLGDLLGVESAGEGQAFPVLSVEMAGEPLGIQIDEIAERIEAPMRPMSGLLAGYPGVMGAVLQGDGQVLLVLDLAELAA